MTREIIIRPVLNGFICTVGCTTVVMASKGQLLAELGRYLEAPERVEKEYLVNAVNRVRPGDAAQCEAPAGRTVNETLRPPECQPTLSEPASRGPELRR